MKEFYSQICTTLEQSQRLLDLGLNPETADMSYYILDNEHLIQDKLNECYNLVVPELAIKYGRGASYGWNGGSCPNENQRKFLAETYYLYREILHFLTKKNSKDDWNVYQSPTLTCKDSGEPIEIKEL